MKNKNAQEAATSKGKQKIYHSVILTQKGEKEMEKREKLMRIFELCLEIQSDKDGELEKRDAEISNKPCATVYYYGHVNIIEIRIYNRGWDRCNGPDIHFDIDLKQDRIYQRVKAQKELDECIETLEKILAEMKEDKE